MALFNNGYPATYAPMYQPYTPVQPQNVAQPSGGLIWVQGEAGAKSYLVAPNTTVALYDSENQVIYLKSADASGMPSMKVLDYTIRENGKNVPSAPSKVEDDKMLGYATKDEIKAVSVEIATLRKRIDKMTKKQEGAEDE